MISGLTFPKAELHCHLLGTINPPLLAHIQSHGGRVLVDPDVLQKVYPVSDLDSFKQWLELLKPYQAASAQLMRPILAAHIASLISQHVVYTEIMLSPTMFPRERQTMIRGLQEWREWTLELEEGKIQVEYLMVIPRSLQMAILESDAEMFVELGRANLIVGIALVGIETGESLERFAPAFERLRDGGLGIEIHAGEHSGPGSVADAVRFGRPHRLGHALSMFQDPSLVESIKSAGIHIEFCVTSNASTGAMSDLKLHPVRRALEQEISFSVNTDDPGAFQCSVASEHRLVAAEFGFRTEDFRNIFRNSLAARFQPKFRLPEFALPGST